MKEKAYGKINLSIDVQGKKEDGYHLLDMIMLPIDLYDEIEIKVAKKMSYSCNIDLPFNEKNIIYITILKLREKYNFKENFSIKVVKNIPLQAGIAGGSSDAAAVIKVLNKMLDLQMSMEEMIEFGAKIGADVPFCLVNKPSRVKGIGEIIRPLELKKKYKALLVKPETGVNTKEAFDIVDKEELTIHPDMDKLEEAFVEGKDFARYMGNSLQEGACKLNEDISKVLNDFKEAGHEDCLMSGSGSTCFVITEQDRDIEALKEKMKEKYPFVYESKIG